MRNTLFTFVLAVLSLGYIVFDKTPTQVADAANDFCISGCSLECSEKTETTEEITEITSIEEITVVSEEHTIENFPVIIQTPELPTGCEITAATMMMNYCGFNADKETMAEYLPKTSDKNLHYGSDGILYGVDLNRYFIGSPWRESGFVCGTQAVVKAVNDYIEQNTDSTMRAIDITGTFPETLYNYTANNISVTVWTTIGMADRYSTEGWYTERGTYVDWSKNDHCSVLIGYNKDNVIIADPLAGIAEYSKERFESVYVSRGSKCVIIENFP